MDEQSNKREPAPLVPPVDIVENAEGITLTADMPGVSKEALSIGVDMDRAHFFDPATGLALR